MHTLKKVPKWAWMTGGATVIVLMIVVIRHRQNVKAEEAVVAEVPIEEHVNAPNLGGAAGGASGAGTGTAWYLPYPEAPKEEAPQVEPVTEPASEPISEAPNPGPEAEPVTTPPGGGHIAPRGFILPQGETEPAKAFGDGIRNAPKTPRTGVGNTTTVVDPNKAEKERARREIDRLNLEIAGLQSDINNQQGVVNSTTNNLQSHPNASQANKNAWNSARDSARNQINQDQANISHKRDEITYWQARL